jgi:hypothetical protein
MSKDVPAIEIIDCSEAQLTNLLAGQNWGQSANLALS